MRILIEATQAFLQHRGWGRFNRELIDALLQSDGEEEFVLFYNRFGRADAGFLESLQSPKAEVFPFDYSHEDYNRLEEDEEGSFLEEYLPPVDLYHSITEFPFFTRGVPVLTTVHDITTSLFPQNRSSDFVQKFNKNLHSVSRRSSWIATPSKNTQTELITYFGANPIRTTVIPLGAAEVFFSAEPLESPPFPVQSFLLFVGATEDLEKRFRWLLESLPLLPDWVNLVVVGNAVVPKALRQRVFCTGRISDESLYSLYRQARLLVMPSVHEGFGLPLVEAMASRCPILGADNSSLGEIIADKGAVFSTESREAFLRGLLKCIEHYPSVWIERAHVEALVSFRWSRCASAYRSLYRQIIEEGL